MTRSGVIAFVALLACLGGCEAEQGPDASHEAEDATEYVIWSLALETSQSVRAARENCGNFCGDHGAGIEVAIDLLGAGQDATTKGLLDLLAVQLDAGPAESRSCQIAKRGRTLAPALRTFDASQAADRCKATFNRLRQRELSEIKDVTIDQICRPAEEIAAERRDWINALKTGEDLLAESSPC